jgi:predicted GNAT family acetyltransferase
LNLDAKQDGSRIVSKVIHDYLSEVNPFDNKKEVLYGVFDEQQLVAIGGINIDPYLMDDMIGRIRHLYVNRAYRNKGIATALIDKILEEKESFYNVIRMSTKNEVAMQLFESFGFKKVVEFKATHIKIV